MSFRVVILSCQASNLVPCIHSVLSYEPGLPPANIVVVDDGARGEAEPLLPGVTWVAGEKPFVFALVITSPFSAASSASMTHESFHVPG